MKDKDIIQETLDKLVKYKIETPHNELFNIFIIQKELFYKRNNIKIKKQKYLKR